MTFIAKKFTGLPAAGREISIYFRTAVWLFLLDSLRLCEYSLFPTKLYLHALKNLINFIYTPRVRGYVFVLVALASHEKIVLRHFNGASATRF